MKSPHLITIHREVSRVHTGFLTKGKESSSVLLQTYTVFYFLTHQPSGNLVLEKKIFHAPYLENVIVFPICCILSRKKIFLISFI